MSEPAEASGPAKAVAAVIFLARRGFLLIAFGVVGLAGGVCWAVLSAEPVTATGTLLIGSNAPVQRSADVMGYLAGRMPVFAQVATSHGVLTDASAQCGATTGWLRGATTAQVVPNTVVVRVQVRAVDDRLVRRCAAALVNSYATALPRVNTKAGGLPLTVQLVDPPAQPSRSGLPDWVKVAAGGALGVAAGAGAGFGVDRMLGRGPGHYRAGLL